MKRLIVFDLDGVLMDSAEIHYEALNRALEDIAGSNFVISKEDHIREYNGRSTRNKLIMLQSTRGLDSNLFESIFSKKQILTNQLLESHICPNKVIRDALLHLKSKYSIACATNCIRATLDMALTSLGIIDLFDFTVSNEDVKYPKPSPEIYRLCMEKAEVSPYNTVIFEDSEIGIAAAYGSGARVICVKSPGDLTSSFIMKALETVNVVIPMAGNGSRFASAGYVDPKPLIPVFGKPMISWVVDNLRIPNARFTFVIRSDYPESCRDYLKQIAPECSIIEVDKVTEGAACTVLLTKDIINSSTPLIIANSDQFIEFSIQDFVNNCIDSEADGSISTFDGQKDPKWSYAAVSDSYVTEVREKDPFSDHATTGVYMWKRGSDFVKYAESMISKNIRVNNEFYVVPTYNEAIQDGKKITISPSTKMWGLGTPEDLEYFLKNYK
jgi:HAD superfamily hydrolase (TIGR01509 family)